MLSRHGLRLTLVAGLSLATFLVFESTSDFSLLTFGDRDLLPAANWTPVTRLFHWLDDEWALNPHRTSLLVHLLSVGLCFASLSWLTLSTWRSFAASVFFALHPLRVQSVAWVAQRHLVLAGCFSFLALAGWARWKRQRSPWGYGVAVAACALALMASPVAVAVPLVLLLLEFWPLESGRWLWREKAPFLAMGLLAGGLWAVRGTAIANWRIAEAFWPALFNTAWPVALSPIAGSTAPGYGALAGWVTVAVLAGAVVLFADRFRFLLTGVGWFAVSLAASVVLSESGWHSYSDRFTYFAHAGLGIVLAWFGYALLGSRASYAGVTLALLMAWQCRVQVSYWRDDATLVARAAELNPSDPNALTLLAHSYVQHHDLPRAIEIFRQAVAAAPRSAETRLELARALEAAHDQAGALAEIDRAIKLAPKLGSVHFRRGSVLIAMNRTVEAKAEFLRALEQGVPPELRQSSLLSLAAIESAAGRPEEAIRYLSLVLERDPKNREALEALERIRQKRSP